MQQQQQRWTVAAGAGAAVAAVAAGAGADVGASAVAAAADADDADDGKPYPTDGDNATASNADGRDLFSEVDDLAMRLYPPIPVGSSFEPNFTAYEYLFAGNYTDWGLVYRDWAQTLDSAIVQVYKSNFHFVRQPE